VSICVAFCHTSKADVNGRNRVEGERSFCCESPCARSHMGYTAIPPVGVAPGTTFSFKAGGRGQSKSKHWRAQDILWAAGGRIAAAGVGNGVQKSREECGEGVRNPASCAGLP
jgi:hypothetical protein